MYIKHVSSCRGSYALPLMGAFVALCLSACQKPGDAVSTPERPSGGGDDEYVTFVLEDENGNTLRAGDGLTPGSTNPLVGEYNYRSQAPNALAYIDLPGTAENGFRMPKTQFKEKGASLPVYLNENAVVVAGRYRFSQDDADKGTTQPLMHETFGKHLTDPDLAPKSLDVRAPEGTDVPNTVYVTLAVEGKEPKKIYDYDLSTVMTGEEIKVPFYTPTQMNFTGYRTVTTRDQKFNWLGFLLTGWNPLMYPIAGIAAELGDDFWFTTTENTQKVPIYDIKPGTFFMKPIESGFVYNFEMKSQTGKPVPTSITLDIVYDEYIYKDCRVTMYQLNPNGEDGTLYPYATNPWWRNYLQTNGSIPTDEFTTIPLDELNNTYKSGYNYSPNTLDSFEYSFGGLYQGGMGTKYPQYEMDSSVSFPTPSYETKKTKRITILLKNGKGSFKAYSQTFKPNTSATDVGVFWYPHNFGTYLPFDYSITVVTGIKVASPANTYVIPINKVEQGLGQSLFK